MEQTYMKTRKILPPCIIHVAADGIIHVGKFAL